VLQGHLDTITSSGLLEGWAYDTDAILDPVEVLIECEDGSPIAQGHAQLFRADLAPGGLGTGWCAFRLRSRLSVSRISRSTILVLEAGSREEIHRLVRPAIREGHEPPHRAVAEVLASDPTVLTQLDQLDGCGPAFDSFVEVRGVEAFVRAAYVYALGRPVDQVGISLYGNLLREGALTPYGLLQVLSESDEFKSVSRLLAAPPTPGFPFRS